MSAQPVAVLAVLRNSRLCVTHAHCQIEQPRDSIAEYDAMCVAVAELIEAAAAIEREVRPYGPQPYSSDSFLPPHMREQLIVALTRCGALA